MTEWYLHHTVKEINLSFDKHIGLLNSLNSMKSRPRNRVYALKQFLRDNSLVVSLADKNLGLVVIDEDVYTRQLHQHLESESFRELDADDREAYIHDTYHRISNIAEDYYIRGRNYDRESDIPNVYKYLTVGTDPNTCRPAKVYLLQKVHKLSQEQLDVCCIPPTRLLVPSHCTVIDHASRYLDSCLRSILVNRCSWLLPDSKQLVIDMETRVFSSTSFIQISDVEKMYPSIPIEDGMNAMRQLLSEERELDTTYVEHLLRMLDLVMHNLLIEHNDRLYIQIKGTAMGTSCAVIFANTFMYILERSLIQRWIYSGYLVYFRRLIDDTIQIFQGPLELAARFWEEYNNLHPAINLDRRVHITDAPFLDLCLYKGPRFVAEGKWDIKLYQKPFNRYSYLPPTSWHTPWSKRSLISTEMLRIVRNNTNFNDYIGARQLFYKRLIARNYKASFILPILREFKHRHRASYLQRAEQRVQLRRPALVIQWNPFTANLDLPRILNKFYEELSIVDDRWSVTSPIVAWKVMPNLWAMLR